MRSSAWGSRPRAGLPTGRTWSSGRWWRSPSSASASPWRTRCPRGASSRHAPPSARRSASSPGRSRRICHRAPRTTAPFKSEKERDQASATALAGVLGSFPRDPGGAHRHAPAGGQPRCASDSWTRPSPTSRRTCAALPPTEPLRAAALDGLGHAREAKGELPQALDAYERMSHEDGGGLRGGHRRLQPRPGARPDGQEAGGGPGVRRAGRRAIPARLPRAWVRSD